MRKYIVSDYLDELNKYNLVKETYQINDILKQNITNEYKQLIIERYNQLD